MVRFMEESGVSLIGGLISVFVLVIEGIDERGLLKVRGNAEARKVRRVVRIITIKENIKMT